MREHRQHQEQHAWRQAHDYAADTNDKLIRNLRDVSHTMRFLYEGKGSQKRILIVLDEIGGNITQHQLTELLGIQPGSASEVIAKLESAGYIRRTPSETDRRTADITLTKTGKSEAAEAKAQRTRRHEEMFSCLSEEEKSTLLSLLEKVNADWETRYQEIEKQRGRGEHPHREQRRREHLHRPKGE